MDDLQNRFNSAAEHVAWITDKAPKKDLLALYGLYKQAMYPGEFKDVQKPGLFDLKGKEKYRSWGAVANLTSIEAKNKYIEKVKALDPEYKYDPNVKSTNSMTKTVSRMTGNGETEDKLQFFLARIG